MATLALVIVHSISVGQLVQALSEPLRHAHIYVSITKVWLMDGIVRTLYNEVEYFYLLPGAPRTQPIPTNTIACPNPKLNSSGPATMQMHSLAEAELKNPKTDVHMRNPVTEIHCACRTMDKPKDKYGNQ